MSEKNISHLVKSISDKESATVKLTGADGKRTSYECIFKESSPPGFFLLFPSAEILADIDLSKSCPFISKDREGHTLSFTTAIIERTSDRILEMVARRAINPEDLREYFRVNISTDITVSFQPETDNGSHLGWELSGEVVDLSRSGILTILPEECKNRNSILIEIDLTSPVKTIYCIGHIIRIKRVKKNRWLTSFHFDDISAKAIDDITVNCLAEQRRQLRENIATAG